MSFLEKVESTMLSHGIMPEKSVLVGLSGGADSAALTHALCSLSEKYGFKVYAAHVNHGLRGDTAKRDEDFSRSLAKALGIEFFCLHAEVREKAKKRGISEELAGREVRYEYFGLLMNENGIDSAATAHHKNDNAETILMNFMRGSGLKGLCGIPYRRGRIIRPLLDVTREEIEKYCTDNGIEYVTDETNLDSVYTRNKVRNILIPEIERLINPSFSDTVTKNSAVLSQEEDYISSETDRHYSSLVSDNSIGTKELTQLHPAIAMRLIRKLISGHCGTEDISSVVISAVLSLAKRNRTGSKSDIARGVYAAVEYNRLYIRKKTEKAEAFDYRLNIGGGQYIPEMGCMVECCYAEERKKDGWEYFSLPDNISEIRIRSRRAGDKFIPSGMTGFKKVKEYMINEKIPAAERDRVGIVTFDEAIAWIAGYRRDNRFKFNKKGIKIRLSY